LKKVINPLPDHVTFIPVDFNTQTLGERLLTSGYNERGKTLFIWQGVTMYLTPEGVDSTLAFIANHSGPGSVVIFDYFYNETLYDMKTVRRITRVIGERLIFGIDEGQIERMPGALFPRVLPLHLQGLTKPEINPCHPTIPLLPHKYGLQ
jgi:methyltransferase (TIGR00027 family)